MKLYIVEVTTEEGLVIAEFKTIDKDLAIAFIGTIHAQKKGYSTKPNFSA